MGSKPEYHTHEEYTNRLRKLSELQELKVEPYPHAYAPSSSIQALHTAHLDQPVGSSEEAQEGSTEEATVAGRMMLFRAMGKNAFAQVQDGTARLQIMINRDTTVLTGYTPGERKPIKVIEKQFDLGDIVGIQGHLFRTNKGELTLFAKEVTLLCKSLLPLPDKHKGLVEKEQRYRKRWLDLIINDEVRDTFYLRSKILRFIRSFMEDYHFMEVETPVLQTIYGGAAARPFKTEFHALGSQEMFLRISLEIALKKLIVGGMERVFEMGKVFRNEGIDRDHNPEFTMLEAYAAYWDYNDMMVFMETMFEKLALELFGKTTVPAHIPGTDEVVELELKAPWKRMTMKKSVLEYGGIDVDALSDDELRAVLCEKDGRDLADLKEKPRGLLIAALFEALAEPHLIQPHHITDHPIETTPLCKLHRNLKEKEAGIVERFETFMLGREFSNAYSELNDPLLQRELLEDQAAQRDAGDEEASPLDEEFIEAICQGMPPTGGIGIGIDRLVMLFADAASIRDILLFPFMKPSA